MEIGVGGLRKISEMICGDNPFDFFPYRSSSYLTRFFADLDLEYKHDGSTRRIWVENVLKDLSSQPQATLNLPSKNIHRVIEHLLHPEHFLYENGVDREKAIEAVRTCLKIYDLTIDTLPNGLIQIKSLTGEFISTEFDEIPQARTITFKPSVFEVPKKEQDSTLISVMMPFDKAFDPVYAAIKDVADALNLRCERADSIWNNSTFIQDIFDLIFCARVVVVDFTGRNSNVMYETGIAHTLGKTVIPITQSLTDMPSDLGHHRALKYLLNEEGLRDFRNSLWRKLKTIYGNKR